LEGIRRTVRGALARSPRRRAWATEALACTRPWSRR
jgi:hypothetical protein